MNANFLIGYYTPKQNIVVKQLKRLRQHHSNRIKIEFDEAKYLSITYDIGKDRKQFISSTFRVLS